MLSLIVAIMAITMVVFMAITALTVTTDANGNLVSGNTEVHAPATVSAKPAVTGSRATTDEF